MGSSAILLAVVVSIIKGFDQIVDDIMTGSTSDGWKDGKMSVRKEVRYKRPLRRGPKILENQPRNLELPVVGMHRDSMSLGR